MVFGALLWLAILPAQSGQLSLESPSYDQVRADALMRRAWQGRNQTVLRLCSDRERVDRLRRIDTLFMRAQQAYQRHFGIVWQAAGVISEGRLSTDYQIAVAGARSSERKVDPKCQSPGGFAGALGEYQNGATLAVAELGG